MNSEKVRHWEVMDNALGRAGYVKGAAVYLKNSRHLSRRSVGGETKLPLEGEGSTGELCRPEDDSVAPPAEILYVKSPLSFKLEVERYGVDLL